MPKKPIPIEKRRKSFVIAILRRASIRWPEKTEALKNSRVGRGEYLCESCGEIFKRQQVQLDHRKPVIDIKKGWTDYNDFVERLFISSDNYSVLCISCHEYKSSQENNMRDHYKKVDKKKKLR